MRTNAHAAISEEEEEEEDAGPTTPPVGSPSILNSTILSFGR
jgi:hypothetical protein